MSVSSFQSRDSLYLKSLAELILKQPHTRACIDRLALACGLKDVKVTENGQRLKPEFDQTIALHMTTFLRQAVDLIYFCGFVPFVFRKVQGVKCPIALSLGSFAWSVGPIEKGKALEHASLHQYQIKKISGTYDENEVLIMPRFLPDATGTHMSSPLDDLLSEFLTLQHYQLILKHTLSWNKNKHLVVSENVDLKDQTTSGIQLLDEFRRYSLTGSVNNVDTGVMRLRTRQNKPLRTVADAMMHHVNQQFKGDDEEESQASTHVMPPNVSVSELQPINLSFDIHQYYEDFISHVYAFFDVARLQDMTNARSNTGGDNISRSQQNQVESLNIFLTRLATYAYAKCYDVPATSVQVVLNIQSRISINSTDDIKKLHEAELLDPGHRKRIRTLFE